MNLVSFVSWPWKEKAQKVKSLRRQLAAQEEEARVVHSLVEDLQEKVCRKDSTIKELKEDVWEKERTIEKLEQALKKLGVNEQAVFSQPVFLNLQSPDTNLWTNSVFSRLQGKRRMKRPCLLSNVHRGIMPVQRHGSMKEIQDNGLISKLLGFNV